VAATLAAVLAGCGGSRTVHFPVDHAKPLPTLTADELNSMCNEMVGEAKDAFSVSCLAQAVTKKFAAGGSEQACQTAYQECMGKLQTTQLDCKLADTSKLQSCNVTVGEYETCTNDMLAYIDRMSSKMSCSMSMEDLLSLQKEMENGSPQPASCKALAPKCPEIFGADDGN
jgi:hypothetical protein